MSNILLRLFVFKSKYNKNKLLILNKIVNFAINIKTTIKLIQQIFNRKFYLVKQNLVEDFFLVLFK